MKNSLLLLFAVYIGLPDLTFADTAAEAPDIIAAYEARYEQGFTAAHARLETYADEGTQTGDLARLLADRMTYASGKRHRSRYVESGSAIPSWRAVIKRTVYGAEDLLQPPAGGTERVMSADADGFIRPARYTMLADGTVELRRSIAMPASGVIRIESSEEYVLLAGAEVIVRNTLPRRRSIRWVSVNAGRADLVIRLRLSSAAELRVCMLDESFREMKPSGEAGAPARLVEQDTVFDALAALPDRSGFYRYLMLLNSLEGLSAAAPDAAGAASHLRYVFSMAGAHSPEAAWFISRYQPLLPADIRDRFGAERLLAEGRADEVLGLVSGSGWRESLLRLKIRAAGDSLPRFLEQLARHTARYPDDAAARRLVLQRQDVPDAIRFRELSAAHAIEAQPETARALITLLECQERFADAAERAAADRALLPDAPLQQARAMIADKKTAAVKQLLLEYVNQCPNPQGYRMLARLERDAGGDDELFAAKAASLDTAFAAELSYRMNGTRLSPYDKYRDADFITELVSAFTSGGDLSADFPYRRDVVFAGADGRVRILREYIAVIRTDDDVNRMGELQLPSNRSEVLVARVIRRDGTIRDSFRTTAAGSSRNITVWGLEKETLLHVAYVTEPLDMRLFGSGFIVSGRYQLQDYWKSAGRTEVLLVNRTGRKMILNTSTDVPVTEEIYEQESILRAAASESGLPRERREPNSGHLSRSLFFYSFWTAMQDRDYLLVHPSRRFTEDAPIPPEIAAAGDDAAKIRAVYTYVNSLAETRGQMDFTIQNMIQVRGNRRADAEDKTFIAKYFFDRIGIVSYSALILQKQVKPHEFHSERFAAAMLLVESGGRKIWLDFSSRYLAPGVTSAGHDGAAAIVFADGMARRETVRSSEPAASRAEWTLDYATGRFTANFRFTGEYTTLRKLFSDNRYAPENSARVLAQYRGDFIPEAVVSGTKAADEFTLSVSGYSSGLITQSGGVILLTPYLRKSDLPSYIAGETRKYPLLIDEEIREQDSWTVTLPEGYAGAEQKTEKRVEFAGGYYRLGFHKKTGSRELRVTQEVFFPAGEIPPEAYPGFRDFCTGLRQAENTRVVITADGNDN